MRTSARYLTLRLFVSCLLLGSSLLLQHCIPSPSKVDPAGDLNSDAASDIVDGHIPSDTGYDRVLDTSPVDLVTEDAENDLTVGDDSKDSQINDLQIADITPDILLDTKQPDTEQPDSGSDQTDTEPPDSGPDQGDVEHPDSSADQSDGVVFTANLLSGILGDAPDTAFTKICDLNVRNDRPYKRSRKIAWSAIPIARADNLSSPKNLVVVDSDGKWIQAQFAVLARWDGALGKLGSDPRPIRWLKIAMPVSVDADSTRVYELRNYDATPVKPDDPLAVKTVASGKHWIVTTGPGRFEINPLNPGLLEQVDVDFDLDGTFQTVYKHIAGAGPRMLAGNGTFIATHQTYDTIGDDANGVYVDRDPDDNLKPHFQVIETGPVQSIVIVRGHFMRPEQMLDCTDNNFSDKLHPFGYTAVMTFTRGKPHIDLQFVFRNECGNADQISFTDEANKVQQVGWQFPLQITGNGIYYSGTGTTHMVDGSYLGEVYVYQSKGHLNTSGAPKWEPNGELVLTPEGKPTEYTEQTDFLTQPWVAVRGDGVIAGVQMPFMRFREPQGLKGAQSSTYGTELAMRLVSQTLPIGEARGIWGRGRFSFLPAAGVNGLDEFFKLGLADLERGLLIRLPLDQFNRTGVYPSLGKKNTPSKLKLNYSQALTNVHGMTMGSPIIPLPSEPGQWRRALTYGSQLWPDIPFSANGFSNQTPYEMSPQANTGNPMFTEIMEFYRTGDPKWVWDFALPQAWLMLHSAWYNTAKVTNYLNGFAINASGPGEGNWLRRTNYQYDLGETHNSGISDAYLLRPTPLFLDRFAQQGLSTALHYDKPSALQTTRDWWNRVQLFKPVKNDDDTNDSGRSLVQHMEALANCAEFVPGNRGETCYAKLVEFMEELVADNLVDGVPCDGDLPSTTRCDTGSAILYVDHFALVSWRYITSLNTGGSSGVQAMLVGVAKVLMDQLIPRNTNSELDPTADWYWVLQCDLDSGKRTNCKPYVEPNHMVWEPVRLKLLALPLIAMQLDPALKSYCSLLKTAYNDDSYYTAWLDLFTTNVFGWDISNATSIRSLVFAVGGLDECP